MTEREGGTEMTEREGGKEGEREVTELSQRSISYRDPQFAHFLLLPPLIVPSQFEIYTSL